ncbi:uncharacterized protein LOC132700925 [Cylas formicarius]|uniref:uncharacterized protein LOC132700925 n=1 Tax=Cylas formicarius TaxID=197179 RepID=UPI0029586956|nr:uncharacterized protein LOC132700925 [Cylas formicarius]
MPSMVHGLSVLLVSVCVFCDHAAPTDKNQQPFQSTGLVEARRKTSVAFGFDLAGLASRILPMLASPFIMQITSLPMTLMTMKLSLMTANFLGMLAIVFLAVNLARSKIADKKGQFYSHNVNLH